MSKITLEPNASGAGTFSIVSPDSNTNRTLNLPDASGNIIAEDTSGNLNITDSIQAEGSIRIGNGFGSGGNATIHNFQKALYLQFNNGNSNDTLRIGGGGTTCDIVFDNNEGGISPNDDTGWISVSNGYGHRTVSHSISLPYHVIPLVRTGTAGSYDGNYSANDIVQSGFNFPNASGLSATGLYFISNNNEIEFFEDYYVGAARGGSNEMSNGFIEMDAIRFLIFKIGQVSL